LKEGILQKYLTCGKEYEVIAIQMTRQTEKTSCGIQYYILRDNYSLGPYDENYFIISSPQFEDDYIIKNADEYDALYILPISLPIGFFDDWMKYCDEILLTEAFYKRFKHLFSEQQLAEFFKEQYQNPSITIAAEAIGDNWIICPECNQAFSVDPNIGELVCPNIACKTKLNNPYAKKFPVEA